ncbi:hypothetical protein [Mangrovicoccus ximenensis]|uniref:hypothetical protein n=1 Tax=Mangrovicoccus ximenensis TaxID=1911570 RepID=UPI0011AE8FFA|nr:hypothetical protein [Mangrovicoccus ximenensis]
MRVIVPVAGAGADMATPCDPGEPSGEDGTEAAACGPEAVRPVIYPQAGSEDGKARAETLRSALGDKGWVLLATEVVSASPSNGDIRYYHAEQLACAEQLAQDIAATGGFGKPKLIYLGDRYRNLPTGRMELWLAAP